MSRWIQQFESHAFQGVWVRLKSSLQTADVDDETVVTSTIELARLKKVISFVDGIINALDPDLVPLATWDSFNGQATPCLQQIDNYNSTRNIAHITQANAHADNLLTYVRPYMVVPSDSVNAMAKSVRAYAKEIESYVEGFRSKSKACLDKISEDGLVVERERIGVEEKNKEIELLHVKLFGGEGSVGLSREVDEIVADFNHKHSEVVALHNELLIGDSDTESTRKTVMQSKEGILEEQYKIENLMEEVEFSVKNLKKFHERMFGKVDVDGERVGGLSKELDERIGVLSDFEQEQKNRYQALNSEIETLLPGATSAGLATAYLDMKKSFDTPIKHAGSVFYWSIGLLVIASIILAVESVGGDPWVTFVKFDNWDVVLKGLAYKIPFYAPVLWLAFYATKRRSEYHRLQQEYAHKEALAKSYNSYKKQIEQLGDVDLAMQKEFIMKAIDAIAYNASETLDGKHGDKMPAQDVIEKVVESIRKLNTQKASAA